MTKSIKFIDLFAGVGGFRIAFESQKAQCVFSSEWDKFSQITYEANFGEKPEGDITLIDSKKIPKHEILTAGFPCQPFSNAGLKKGFEDTRGTLFYDVARIINDKKPSMVLLENVKGFVNHNKGRTLRVVLETLDELGYNTNYKVLNAKDFGVPQNRERIFIVGVNRKKLGKIGFEFPDPLYKKTALGQILEKNPDSKYTISNKLWQGHKRRLKEHRLKGNGFGYGMFNEESTHTNTISARYYKDGSEILISQGRKNPRMLTPREAARLQGFPEKFIIPVSDTQAYRQFGNSVAVPVVKEIAKKMIDIIENPSKGKPYFGYIQRELEL
jgi:DNA (cytosine-5)-methyltransferase 1